MPPKRRIRLVTYDRVGTYRGACSTCGWRGPIRNTTRAAEADRERHRRTAAHRKRAGRA